MEKDVTWRKNRFLGKEFKNKVSSKERSIIKSEFVKNLK